MLRCAQSANLNELVIPEDNLIQSASALAHAIATGQTTSEAVVSAHLDRIDVIDPDIHALVQRAGDALEQAREADRRQRAGQRLGPLHGVPFTVKDWIETNDLVCSAGYEQRRDYLPRRDATVVARLRAAGGILLGKTKAGATADLYPLARNPHDLSRTCGASSSGEAALIAAGGSPVGLGSDSGGSLRWPAHCCGIATLKPSTGLVPLTGHFPPIIAMTDPRTVVGPMARHVADLAMVLDVISGEDGEDASTLPIPVGDYRGVDLRELRVAWFANFTGAACDTMTADTIRHAAQSLRDSGAQITEDCPELIETAMPITEAYWARPESTSLTKWRPPWKSKLSADEVEQSLFEWDRLKRAFTRFMANYDAVICPVAATSAPRRLDVKPSDYAWTVPFSLTGQPGVVIPFSRDADLMPLGVQIVAKPFRDHIALAIAARLEQGRDGV